MRDKKSYLLSLLIILSAFICSMIGDYWNAQYYNDQNTYTLATPALATAMQGIHDKLYIADIFSLNAEYAVNNLSTLSASDLDDTDLSADARLLSGVNHESGTSSGTSFISGSAHTQTKPTESETYRFTTASDDYFADACFIGDSRTVGISEYSGIEGATFLCKTSLSIYDYDKPKITYENVKTSIHDVLEQKQFAKIYLMVGINECGIGTPQSFFEQYRDVVSDIRSLQPDALIFLQGNLLVTQKKSDESQSITNENITARNELIATLANQKDIFYIDINESSLCEEGALVPDYTWDQVHIKAQYYPLWKEFLLEHAIVI